MQAQEKTDGINLMTPSAYAQERSAAFPSLTSLLWFLRRNRAELVERGALLFLTGRKTIAVGPMDEAVLDIGSRSARSMVRRWSTDA